MPATPGLFFLGPIAVAAVAATGVAAAGGPVWLQIVVFGAGSFAAVGLLRPIARKHLTMPRAIRTGAAALEGAKAIVLQPVSSRGGRVKIGGEEWSARSYVPDEEFDVGAEVEVVQNQRATALVYR
jgi:membrane protein implicated in regulation of membrane protease activity